MRTLIAAAMIMVLSACTTYSNSLTYRPRNYDGAPYVITPELNPWTNEIIIKVDGKTVIQDRLSLLDDSGEFVGKHEGHKVHVSCNGAECTVLIDNELVGKF